MPTGYYGIMPDVVTLIRKKQPKTVLEIGTGFGKWGVLVREYLEVYGHNKWKLEDRFVKIDGVEVFAPYVSPIHRFVYDNIFIEDITTLAPRLGNYQTTMMFDVLEHIPKRQAEIVLKSLMAKSELFLLSVPLGQEALYHFAGENEKESHISAWEFEELAKYPNCVFSQIYQNKPVNIGLFAYEAKSS